MGFDLAKIDVQSHIEEYEEYFQYESFYTNIYRQLKSSLYNSPKLKILIQRQINPMQKYNFFLIFPIFVKKVYIFYSIWELGVILFGNLAEIYSANWRNFY